MAGARRRGEWAQTLAILDPLCLIANSKLKQGSKPFRASIYNPFGASKPNPPASSDTVRDIVAALVPKK